MPAIEARRTLIAPACAAMLLLPLLAGCATPRIDVATSGDRAATGAAPAPLAAEAGDGALAARLVARGIAAPALPAKSTPLPPVVVSVAATSRPSSVGVCLEPGATPGAPCRHWAAMPKRGWQPFGPVSVHLVAVRFTDPATGRTLYEVAAAATRRKADPALLRPQLLDAAIACAGCAAGTLARH